MNEYQTNNQVPSKDPRDLDDNATIFDRLLNEEVPSVLDRLLVPRKTWWQMEQDANALVSPNVSALAGLTLAVNKGIYATGAGALATYDLTAQARTFAAATTVADQRTVLGLGTVATESTVPLNKGGTGATTAAAARTALGAAPTVSPAFTGSPTTPTPALGGSTLVANMLAIYAAMVGTVQDTGGVPSGSAMEFTTGAGGDCYRFASGLQICVKSVATGAVNNAAGGLFTSLQTGSGSFTKAFVGVPIVLPEAHLSSGGGWASGAYTASTATTWGTYALYNHVTSANTGTLNLVAIGRWK